jgi:hypothetical protein
MRTVSDDVSLPVLVCSVCKLKLAVLLLKVEFYILFNFVAVCIHYIKSFKAII